jgi:hypothetical protein
MKRREFLMGAAAVAGAAGIARPLKGYAAQQAKQAALDRISIMTLNFQNMLKVIDTQPSEARTLDLFDLPQMIADTYGVHKIEFQHYHLGSLEESYVKDLKSALSKSKSTAQQINLEFSGLNISAPSMRDRLLAIDLTKQFVDHAVTLGAKRVMINQGAQGGQTPVMPTSENKVYSIPALKTMADYGRSKGIIVSVETRGGGGGGGNRGRAGAPGAAAAAAAGAAAPAPPAPPAAPPAPPPGTPARGVPTWTLLMEIITAAGAYSNVDVGGAAAMNQEELHQCLRIFFPRTANSMHTRVNQNWDLATAMRFLEKDLGYKGLYTIEAGGGHQGTKQIYDVVVATLPGLMA